MNERQPARLELLTTEARNPGSAAVQQCQTLGDIRGSSCKFLRIFLKRFQQLALPLSTAAAARPPRVRRSRYKSSPS